MEHPPVPTNPQSRTPWWMRRGHHRLPTTLHSPGACRTTNLTKQTEAWLLFRGTCRTSGMHVALKRCSWFQAGLSRPWAPPLSHLCDLSVWQGFRLLHVLIAHAALGSALLAARQRHLVRGPLQGSASQSDSHALRLDC